MAAARLIVSAEPRAPGAWAAALEPYAAAVLERVPSPEACAALGAAEFALLDGTASEPLRLAQQVHALEPSLQLAVVAPAEQRAALARAQLFTPGLGELWLLTPDEVDVALAERAAEVTRRRRAYRATRQRIEHDLAARAPAPARRPGISDAYLAGLLLALPDPVVAVDAQGRVLTWNPAAERTFGVARHDAVGRALAEVLHVSPAAALQAVLGAAGAAPARGELRFRGAGGEPRVGEVIAFSVAAADRQEQALILRDVSEQRRAHAELEQQAAALQQQAAELESLNQALHERTGQLESALAARARFYASMSHELRTPINAIIGYNALLLDGIFGPVPEAQLHGIERSQRAAQHLLELVNDVLDLAKIEAGRIELQVEPARFPTLLAELLDTVHSLAERHGSELRLEGPAHAHHVVTDPRRLRQILLNLLSNAVKYGAGKPVRLRWAPTEQGGVRIDVVDAGVGIPAEQLPKVFEEFVRLDPQATVGTGLGLPISRALAQALGAALSATSTPGEGSTFRLELPAVAPAED